MQTKDYVFIRARKEIEIFLNFFQLDICTVVDLKSQSSSRLVQLMRTRKLDNMDLILYSSSRFVQLMRTRKLDNMDLILQSSSRFVQLMKTRKLDNMDLILQSSSRFVLLMKTRKLDIQILDPVDLIKVCLADEDQKA